MKRSYIILLFALAFSAKAFSQTTLTEDANGVLNTTKIVTQTSLGQTFFTGHQIGTGYYTSAPIFQAITDNTGGINYFYSGLSGSTTTFSVRSDGQGYFAGNVGIGTATPQAALSIKATLANGMLRLTPTTDNTEASIGFNTHANESDFTSNWVIGPGGWNSGSSFIIGTTAYNGPLMTFFTSGNIGIGASDTKGYKLAVNGSVVATSITVKSYANWPDYVFKSSYHLPSLSEVKTYVDLNHHLPEIPSEKEIATNGLNLGDIDRLLTKKVEELTLYLIDKDKQLNDEKEVNDVQENKIDSQANIIKDLALQLKSQQVQINELKELIAHFNIKHSEN